MRHSFPRIIILFETFIHKKKNFRKSSCIAYKRLVMPTYNERHRFRNGFHTNELTHTLGLYMKYYSEIVVFHLATIWQKTSDALKLITKHNGDMGQNKDTHAHTHTHTHLSLIHI